jgi:ABC-2 type transport system permease protein
MPFVVIIIVILGVAMKLQIALSFTSMLVALLALILALIIRFMLAYIIALLAFWTQNIGALLSVNDTFVFLLAGQAAPIALFPGLLKQIALLLPYPYMLSFPVEVLLGKISGSELYNGIIIQCVWVAALFIMHHFIYKAGVKRYTAIGG